MLTITHDVFDITVQGPLLLISGGKDLKPVQTCSLDGPPSNADIWRLMKHVQSPGVVTHPTGMLPRYKCNYFAVFWGKN